MTVVTGLGTVSAAGVGREPLLAALGRGAPVLSDIDRSQGLHPAQAARRVASPTCM